jgi:hypothetical protein
MQLPPSKRHLRLNLRIDITRAVATTEDGRIIFIPDGEEAERNTTETDSSIAGIACRSPDKQYRSVGGGTSLLRTDNLRRGIEGVVMNKLKSEVISRRRALSLLGSATFGLTVAGTVLTVSDAEAQTQQPASEAPVTGTERRQERRTVRSRRRRGRRAAVRKGREERRELRHERGEEKGKEKQ